MLQTTSQKLAWLRSGGGGNEEFMVLFSDVLGFKPGVEDAGHIEVDCF